MIMKAAVLKSPAAIASRPLEIRDIPVPAAAPGQILVRVRACGLCRTDLHIVEGELKPLRNLSGGVSLRAVMRPA